MKNMVWISESFFVLLTSNNLLYQTSLWMVKDSSIQAGKANTILGNMEMIDGFQGWEWDLLSNAKKCWNVTKLSPLIGNISCTLKRVLNFVRRLNRSCFKVGSEICSEMPRRMFRSYKNTPPPSKLELPWWLLWGIWMCSVSKSEAALRNAELTMKSFKNPPPRLEMSRLETRGLTLVRCLFGLRFKIGNRMCLEMPSVLKSFIMPLS